VVQDSVGVIGLGAMGGAIVRRLVESGVRTFAHDIDPAAVERAVAAGAIAASAGDAAAVGALITSLPNDEIVRSILSAELFDRLRGGTLVEMSTVAPATLREVAELAVAAGVGVVDSPVSGGPDNALAGTLVCLVGAEDHDLDAVRPVLELLGRIERVGPPGSGKAVKLVNNMLSIGNLVLASEGFAMAKRLGLDPALLLDVLSRSGASSRIMLRKLPAALAGDVDPGFAVRLAAKDLRLTLSTGGTVDAWLPVASAISSVLEQSESVGLGDLDIAAVLRVFE
jgi:3-hydroxyisobutyrate dehydrogenase-like beta-hydroxyacid dehydrogenase